MKLSLCNEVLGDLPFDQQCLFASGLGYAGLELAPFTLAQDPFALDEAKGRAFAKIASDHGLSISSLHWLLVQPEGLSLVSESAGVRKKTLDLLHRLIDFAAACGASTMVHGSPKQRSPGPGQSIEYAQEQLQRALAELAPHAEQAKVVYCLEPLAPFETGVINTVAQAAALVDQIGSPALRTMLDVSAASHSESLPLSQVLAQYLASGHIAHVQVNDKNRRGPGQGMTAIAPVIDVLQHAHYAGWIAVEPFQYLPDGPSCAAFCAGYMQALVATNRPSVALRPSGVHR
jgi:D-psicose/D-tagatose/L-ribulose 3-epimerase